MLYVMGFLTEEPPPIGRHIFDPANLHLTYLDYAQLSNPQINTFLERLSKVIKWHEPLEVQLEEKTEMFGMERNIPAKKLERFLLPKHSQLNADLVRITKEVEGEVISRFDYNPHVTRVTEPLRTQIKHLSVIHHEGELGKNSHNLANFILVKN